MIIVNSRSILMQILSLSLCAKLTSGCASADSSAVPLKTYDWERPLEKGAAAPYSGVLVPEDAYRFYQTDSIAYPECKDKLKDALVSCSEAQDEGWLTGRQLFFVVAGFTLGLFAHGSPK